MSRPDPALFSVNERPREYEVDIEISGTMTLTVMADSEEDAQRQADEIADKIADDQHDINLNEVDDLRVGDARKTRPMYRVTRDGAKMQVSRLEIGDLPRDPDERGF